ncbi:MAG: sulfatase [Acidobacteriota bacterium]
MRRVIALSVAVGLAACGSEEPAIEGGPTHAGINVLLVTVDTLRADHLSCYGYPRQTSPAVDRLAARGVVFDSAYTYWPKTRGSFAAMFTSLYAAQHGLTVRDRDLPEFNRTLAEVLQERGYRTAAVLDNGNLDRALGFGQGFELYEQVWLTPGTTELDRTEALTRFALDFLSEEDEEDPFFLWIHYVNPHTPYDPPEELLSGYREDGLLPRGPELPSVVGYHGGVNRKLARPGEARLGDYIDRYDAEIALADGHVGRVLEALETSAFADSTLVLFTSDHGESLGEHDYFFDHGRYLFNASLRVPLVLSLPGVLPTGERVRGPVSTLDIFPTILDLTQISFPPRLEGRSLLPLVRRTKEKLHPRLFFQNDRHLMAISNGRLKLISHPGGEGEEARYELYDTWRDPGEIEDRFPGSRRRMAPFVAELERFRTRTVAWQQDTTRKRQGVAARTDQELSEETLRNLEALGYLGGGASKKKPVDKKKR